MYWTLLYKQDVSRPELQKDTARYYLTVFMHSVPQLCLYLNYKSTGARMRRGDAKYYLPVLGIAYPLNNYLACKAQGVDYIYWILDWSSNYCFVAIAVLMLLVYFVHELVTIVTHRLDPIA